MTIANISRTFAFSNVEIKLIVWSLNQWINLNRSKHSSVTNIAAKNNRVVHSMRCISASMSSLYETKEKKRKNEISKNIWIKFTLGSIFGCIVTYFSAIMSRNMTPIRAHQEIDNFSYSGIDCKKNIAMMNISTIPDFANKGAFLIGYWTETKKWVK